MPAPVLVTISGMVGAGKSSGERRLVRHLRQEGVHAESWRFRTLPCFTFSFGSPPRAEAPPERAPQTVRGRGYKRRRLTLSATAGFLGRMVSFRIYRRLRQPAGWTVCNRYFYDSLAHFELERPETRAYLSALRWFMPRADLALLFVASPAVIAERRPLYATEYVDEAWRAYSGLATIFPELVVVSSDPGDDGHAMVERLAAEALRRR